MMSYSSVMYMVLSWVMDLRNVFRKMIQVGFIDGTGLTSYGTGYVGGRT
jgi:hypothetical protein